MEDFVGVEDKDRGKNCFQRSVLELSGILSPHTQMHATICGELHGSF